MKRIVVVLLGVFFLFGCGAAARESAYYEHNTMYRNFSHLKFSIVGFKDEITPKVAERSKKQDWWGITYPKSK
ncbi:MAG: hypothetical protein FJ122_15570 [Deltaproteobacteria bacterium]|nr:hypothetical protein [Deltaproteobacteria bacterium]